MKIVAPLKLVLTAAAWLATALTAAAQFGPPQFGPPQSGAWVPARPVAMQPQPPGSQPLFGGQQQSPVTMTSDRPGDGGLQWPLPASVRAHPAVCRIVVPTHDGESWGSGTLVDVTDRYGLVLTNWHVVDEATSEISVIFPDGFRSGGRVLKVDRDWDLAAIAIWRPNIQPVPLSTHVPQPGDSLSIAGYGSGQYRALSGKCTQYMSPGPQFPFDMLELTAAARQGDSGGPIFNNRGELAGVLFGQGEGRTSGSHIGRVRWFLASVLPSAAPNTAVQGAQSNPAAVPTQPDANATPQKPSGGGLINTPFANNPQSSAEPPRGVAATPISQRETSGVTPPWPPAQSSAAQAPAQRPNQTPAFQSQPSMPQAVSVAASEPGESTMVSLWNQVAGTTPVDRLKSILAMMGILAVLSRIIRFVRK